MKRVIDLTGSVVRLLEADVDTDQIVPARFLRTSTAQGLGPVLFHDRRYTQDGKPVPSFPLNPPSYQGQPILMTGPNFGCGSSREHAAWAFLEFGIKAIIAPSFADIFFNNALKNGLVPVTLAPLDHERLLQTLDRLGAATPVTVSLARLQVEAPGLSLSFKVDPFARYCLLAGTSPLDFILENETAIARFEREHWQRLPDLPSFA